MNRRQLEHAIRASGAISGDTELYVVGSQSILGRFPDAPAVLCRSMEVDIAPKNLPELEIVIEGAIGELSPFHNTFGFYVDGVDIAAIALPAGWQERLVVVENANTNGYRGLCLDPSDLAVAKLVARREKDLEFVSVLLRERLVPEATLAERLPTVPGISLAEAGELLGLVRSLAANPPASG